MSDYYYQNNSSGSGFLSNIPVVTKNLIFINIIMFLATLINQDMMVSNFALFYPSSPFFRWWQIITHMFMHGGFWHLFFNMYTLFIFGFSIKMGIFLYSNSFRLRATSLRWDEAIPVQWPYTQLLR